MGRVPEIDAVVFDNDGLFVDTQTLWKRAQERLFTVHGVPYGTSEEEALLGLSRADSGAALTALLRQPPGDGQRLYDALETLVFEELAAGCEFMPGALRLAERLRAASIPLGLASNSSHAFVQATLEAVGGHGLFDTIVTVDDVRRPKPAPDLYLEACAQLEADAGRAVALEDSPIGIKAAVAAGMFVIAVPSPGATDLSGAGFTVTTLDAPEVEAFFASKGIALR